MTRVWDGDRFEAQQRPGTCEIRVFINDEQDRTEECLCVAAAYA